MQRREIVDINPWVRRARSSLLDVCERNECARSDQGLHHPLVVIIEIVDTEFGGCVRMNTLRYHDCSPSAFGRGEVQRCWGVSSSPNVSQSQTHDTG